MVLPLVLLETGTTEAVAILTRIRIAALVSDILNLMRKINDSKVLSLKAVETPWL
jgi:hypothetical protein